MPVAALVPGGRAVRDRRGQRARGAAPPARRGPRRERRARPVPARRRGRAGAVGGRGLARARPAHARLERPLDRASTRARRARRRARDRSGRAGAALVRLRAARAGLARAARQSARGRRMACARALRELGLPSRALVFELGELDPATDARARSLWDGAALVRSYRAARREIDAQQRAPRRAAGGGRDGRVVPARRPRAAAARARSAAARAARRRARAPRARSRACAPTTGSAATPGPASWGASASRTARHPPTRAGWPRTSRRARERHRRDRDERSTDPHRRARVARPRHARGDRRVARDARLEELGLDRARLGDRVRRDGARRGVDESADDRRSRCS